MMRRIAVCCLLTAGLLGGCTTNQLGPQTHHPVATQSYSDLQVQVRFDHPDHSAYLANQLVSRLARHGVNARVLPPQAKTPTPADNAQAILQLQLTEAWTETFISTRRKHRYSLTQMRGRIPRESPRFHTAVRLVDLSSGTAVWQVDILTAGAWYSEFQTNADALAAKITKQLAREGLIQGTS